jgi:uncharacterized membrane protein YedE/YeeE
MRTFKALCAAVALIVDAVVLLAAIGMLLGGYYWWAGLAGAAAVGALAVAAWRLHDRPTSHAPATEWLVWDTELDDGLSDVERQMLRYGYVSVDDPVDLHHAEMIRALTGQTAVLPEHDLITPPRPGTRRRRTW